MTIQLTIDRIRPDNNAQATVYYNGRELDPINDTYEFVVTAVGESELEIEVL